MAKQTRYSSKKGNNEVEDIAERLAADLRGHIRTLGHFPMLSHNWCEMADVLGRVASISDVETKLSAGKDDATLWETEELALRYLLEDGKLNLCLRNLVEYKDFERESRKDRNDMSAANREKCLKFETGLGTILRNAWNHVEAVQTTDIQTLVNHIANVLDYAVACPSFVEESGLDGNLHLRQEVLVFYYIVGVMKQLDYLHEDRVMPIIRERNIFMQGVKFLDAYHQHLQEAPTLKIAEALSLIAESEDFSTYKDQYIADSDDAACLVRLSDSVIDELKRDSAKKRILRPLIDTIMQMRRRHRLK